MDWHWNTRIKWSLLFSNVENHHSTTMTQSKRSSRRWWSSPLWPSYWWTQEKQLDNTKYCQWRWKRTSSMHRIGRLKNGYQFWQKVEDPRKGFNIAWIRTILINSCTFEQFKDIQEVLSILHCKTMNCYQTVLPRRFITSETNTMRPETNSNDFGGFLELIRRFEFEFCRRENYFFWTIRIFGAFMWMCRGLFVPTQFHFECCGVLDDSWWEKYTFQWNHCGRSCKSFVKLGFWVAKDKSNTDCQSGSKQARVNGESNHDNVISV